MELMSTITVSLDGYEEGYLIHSEIYHEQIVHQREHMNCENFP